MKTLLASADLHQNKGGRIYDFCKNEKLKILKTSMTPKSILNYKRYTKSNRMIISPTVGVPGLSVVLRGFTTEKTIKSGEETERNRKERREKPRTNETTRITGCRCDDKKKVITVLT